MTKVFKKSLSVIVALALCLTAMAACFVVNAEGAPTITVSGATGKAGDEVTVTVSGSGLDETAIVGLDFSIDFGSLIFKSATNGGLTVVGDNQDEIYKIDDAAFTFRTVDAQQFGTIVGPYFSLTFEIPAGATGTLAVTPVVKYTTDTEFEVLCTAVAGTVTVTSAHTHEASTTWQNDATNHWNVCTADDGEIMNLALHTWDAGIVTTPATETTEGVKTYTCTVCAGTKTETIAVLPHTHVEASKTITNVTTTEFIYTCTCSGCAETFTKTVAIDATPLSLSIVRTIEPANDFSLLYRCSTSLYGSYTDLTAVIVKDVYASNVVAATKSTYYLTNPDTVNVSGTNYFEFKFSNIAAYEMNSAVNFTVYGKNAQGNMVILRNFSGFSVTSYVNTILAGAYDNNLKKSLVDMLNYGAATQTYGKFNVANLANASLTPAQLALGTQAAQYPVKGTTSFVAIPSTQYLDETTPAGRVSIDRTLALESKVNLVFALRTTPADLGNYYVKFDYYDKTGASQTYTACYGDDAVDYNMSGMKKAIKFDSAPISTLSYPVSATVYYGNPASGGTAVTRVYLSIESYISTYLSAGMGADFDNLLKTMYAYGYSMASYSNIPVYQP